MNYLKAVAEWGTSQRYSVYIFILKESHHKGETKLQKGQHTPDRKRTKKKGKKEKGRCAHSTNTPT